MHTPQISTKRVLAVVAATALAVATTVAVAGTSEAATATYTATPKTGPTTAGQVISIAGTGFQTAAGSSTLFAGATGVQFTTGTCPATHAAATSSVLDSTAKTVTNSRRVVATAPALPLTAAKATAYNICVYGTANSNALLGVAKYTAYPVAAITGANVPASGPAAGGNTVVISGTGFTPTTKVMFGTVASPKVTAARDGLSVTAVAPAQAAGAVAVSVTTEGGTNPTPGTASWDDYTYVNAISVSPAFGDGTAGNAITVTGVGFTAGITGANSGVVFTRAGMTTATDDIAKCSSIQIVSDKELICVAPTLADGAYIVVATSDDTSASAAFQSVVSSSAVFAAADF
jgi:hypothetical protein